MYCRFANVWLFLRQTACLLLLVISSQGHTENYPSKPLRWIVPYPAGGGADTIARLIAQRLTQSWGQQVVVDNRPGATGSIGTLLAAKATPDGYTILMGNTGTHGINPSLFKKPPYDPINDFAPITLIARPTLVLVVPPSLGANSVTDLITLAKARPGKLTFGSAGIGSAPHLAGELFKLMARINIVHVPYKGGAPGLIDLLGGHISMYFSTVVSAASLVKSGKLRALGVTTKQRSAAIPNVPTISESGLGLADYEESNWYVVLAPAETPRLIVDMLHKNIVNALNSPDIKDSLAKDGALVIGSTPEECAAFIRKEISKYAMIIKAAGIVAE